MHPVEVLFSAQYTIDIQIRFTKDLIA